MFDWHVFVAERLSALRMTPSRRDEVVAEIAAHMEEAFQAYRLRGLGEDEARALVLDEVRNWDHFVHEVCEA